MPIYAFGTGPDDFGLDIPGPQRLPERPLRAQEPPALRQLSHAQGGQMSPTGPGIQSLQTDLEEFLIPGFKALDGGMRRYWSGIRVPTKDSYRFMRVKIAGGDRTLMIWDDELKGGRVRLPVAAIDRTGHDFNPEKYSPPTLPMAIKYPTKRGDLAIKVFRPVPFLVEYRLYIWAERKRDADYILYQALTRFNPLAEFRMFDGHLQGTITCRFGGSTDASDKEIGYDQHANVRYELSTTAEAWLPLPEMVVKTVLGRVNVIQERLGEILLAGKGTSGWIEPIDP